MRQAFSQSGSGPWVITAIGLFGLATAGRSLSRVLLSASAARVWRLPVERKAGARVMGAVAGLVVVMGLLGILINRARTDLGLAAAGCRWGPRSCSTPWPGWSSPPSSRGAPTTPARCCRERSWWPACSPPARRQRAVPARSVRTGQPALRRHRRDRRDPRVVLHRRPINRRGHGAQPRDLPALRLGLHDLLLVAAAADPAPAVVAACAGSSTCPKRATRPRSTGDSTGESANDGT